MFMYLVVCAWFRASLALDFLYYSYESPLSAENFLFGYTLRRILDYWNFALVAIHEASGLYVCLGCCSCGCFSVGDFRIPKTVQSYEYAATAEEAWWIKSPIMPDEVGRHKLCMYLHSWHHYFPRWFAQSYCKSYQKSRIEIYRKWKKAWTWNFRIDAIDAVPPVIAPLDQFGSLKRATT